LAGSGGGILGSFVFLTGSPLVARHATKPIATTATAPPAIYFLFCQVHPQQLFILLKYVFSFSFFSSPTTCVAALG